MVLMTAFTQVLQYSEVLMSSKIVSFPGDAQPGPQYVLAHN